MTKRLHAGRQRMHDWSLAQWSSSRSCACRGEGPLRRSSEIRSYASEQENTPT